MKWFVPAHLPADVGPTIAQMSAKGVNFDVDNERVWYSVEEVRGHEILLKRIGFIIVGADEAITCVFRAGCTARDTRALLGTVQLVLDEGPDAIELRHAADGSNRFCHLTVRADPVNDPSAATLVTLAANAEHKSAPDLHKLIKAEAP